MIYIQIKQYILYISIKLTISYIIYTDINQQSTDQQRNMPAQYYSSLKSFITFFYKTNEEMTAAQKAENERKCSLVLKYCETNYRRIGLVETKQLNFSQRQRRGKTKIKFA